MGISTFPAATTGVSGTPVLKLSVPSINVDYSLNSTMNSYDLATPLPAGTYAVTSTSNNPCQVVFLKSDGTIVNAGKNTAVSTTTVITTVIDIPAGQTVTKIIFRKPARASFPTTFNVEINAITDPKSFYGHSLKQYNTAAPLPTNWSTSITQGGPMRPGSMKVTSTTTKSYFMAFNTTFTQTAVASGTLGSNLQDGVRLYELDISTMALTQKASPSFGSTITVAAGFTFPGGSTAQNLYHFSQLQTFFLVGTDVAYFVPGASHLNYSLSGTTYWSMRQFRYMSVYTFATNTWADHNSSSYALVNSYRGYVPAVCGNDLYVGPLGYTVSGNWWTSAFDTWSGVSTGGTTSTAQTIHGAYNYATSTWGSKNTTNLDGDTLNGFNPGSEVKIYSPYVKCTTNYQYTTAGNTGVGVVYNPVSNTHVSITRTSSPALVPDSYEATGNFNNTSISMQSEHARWAPHPTDPKLVYVSPLNSGWIYLMDTEKYGQFGVFALSTFTNGCLTRTAYPNHNNHFFVTHDGKFYNIVNSPAAGQTGSISYIAEIQPIPAALDTGY